MSPPQYTYTKPGAHLTLRGSLSDLQIVPRVPGEGLWAIYLEEAEKEDQAMTDRWQGQMEGILIFVRTQLPRWLR